MIKKNIENIRDLLRRITKGKLLKAQKITPDKPIIKFYVGYLRYLSTSNTLLFKHNIIKRDNDSNVKLYVPVTS